jgi:hypothetical protein
MRRPFDKRGLARAGSAPHEIDLSGTGAESLMYAVVTGVTQKHEIIGVETDGRVVDVEWCDLDLVMRDAIPCSEKHLTAPTLADIPAL